MTETSKKWFFASDFHLGIPGKLPSNEREKQLIRWLDMVVPQAAEIFLVGDLFDFWFEYKTVVPKGYTRVLGKLADISDHGIPIHFFTGNHDMWVFQYFEEELGIKTYRAPITRTLAGKQFFIGHGDGLGPSDHGYKFIKKVFANPFCQWLFERFHPNFGIGLANFWSHKSRKVNPPSPVFYGEGGEWLISFSNDYLQKNDIDFFIFGHRHLTIDHQLKNGQSRYINLGEWLFNCSYATFDGNDLTLSFFENESGKIYGNNGNQG